MGVDFLPQPNDTFKEDIATVAPGTVIIGHPVQVWQVIIVGDIAQSGVIEFSDDVAAYTGADRKFKVYLSSGQFTQPVSFPHGLNITKGLCAISNVAGVDVFVSFD